MQTSSSCERSSINPQTSGHFEKLAQRQARDLRLFLLRISSPVVDRVSPPLPRGREDRERSCPHAFFCHDIRTSRLHPRVPFRRDGATSLFPLLCFTPTWRSTAGNDINSPSALPSSLPALLFSLPFSRSSSRVALAFPFPPKSLVISVHSPFPVITLFFSRCLHCRSRIVVSSRLTSATSSQDRLPRGNDRLTNDESSFFPLNNRKSRSQ